MKRRLLVLRALALANALATTAAFVGCPARKDPTIVTIATPPALVTIAPYGGSFQQLLPPGQTPATTSQDSPNDNRGR